MRNSISWSSKTSGSFSLVDSNRHTPVKPDGTKARIPNSSCQSIVSDAHAYANKTFEKVCKFQTDDQKAATIVSLTSPLSYQVETEDGQRWRRHTEQLKKRYVTGEENHRAEKIESLKKTTREESEAASQSPDTASVK
ncbi:hypothetical protein T06_11275 [Trichinella sp. T6]|nr:hypothetical protein T06_11275 [Trichinella sp. T6]